MKKEVSLSEGFPVIHYLKAFCGAFFITVIVFALVSALFSHVDIPESVWKWIQGYSAAFSCFLAALFSAIGTRKMGYLTGMVSSLCYMMLLFFVGAVIFPGEIALDMLFRKLFQAAIFGTFGGIFGINLKTKKTVL